MTKHVLWAWLGLAAVACGGASAPPASTASTTPAPAASGGAAPAGSAAAANPGGPTRDQMRAVLKDHARELKACYDREKDRGMSYKGETKFKVKIAPDGKVADVQPLDVTPQSDFLASCVQEQMKSWTFPASPGGSSAIVPVMW